MRRIILFLACCLLLSFTACAGKGNISETRAGGSGKTDVLGNDAALGTELNVAMTNLPATMDPQLAADTISVQYLDPIVGHLFREDAKEGYVPELAEGFTVSGDGLTYTIKLKEGLFYSNGSPITAADFVYAVRRIADPKNASADIFLIEDVCKVKNVGEVNRGELPIEELGVHAPDERTFVIELEMPCPYLPYVLSKPALSPCNRDFVESRHGNYAISPETMLSSGPFYVDRYEPLGLQTHYVKNPYFVDADQVSLSGISMRQVANMQEAMMCYESGDVDITPISGEYAVLSGGDAALKERTGGIIFYLGANGETNAAWGNKNIRMALADALDRESIEEKYYRTGTMALTRIIPEGFAVEPDGSDFSKDKGRYGELCAYDPAKAKECWEKGLKELGVSDLTVNIIAGTGSEQLLEIMKDQLEKTLPGLTLESRTVPMAQFLDTMQKGDYEFFLFGWSADYPDPNSFLGLFDSESPYNYSRFEDEEYDRFMSESAYEIDPVKRMGLLHKAEDIIMEEMAVIPLFARGSSYLIPESVTGVEIGFSGDLLYLMKADVNKKEAVK